MSYMLSSVTTGEDLTILNLHNISHKKNHRNILKAKEYTYKHKCSKALKNKLKKYKLRHDGNQDPDILDVSQILRNSLNIKSPNCQNNNSVFDENYPRNYLFKMGRRKQIKHNENSNLNNPLTSLSVDKNEDIQLGEGKSKHQTNAFKLLMDSRNKSIGGNSPGKEKVLNENVEVEEVIEKKTIKVKRNLALQKLAESKGSLKKKEMEEYQDYCINKKMEKRAERLKAMIATNTKTERQINKSNKSKSSNKSACELINDVEVSKQKTLTLVSIFNSPVNKISPERKIISKEDDDFLKKLSPSLKKKENMLCYFQKVENPLSTDLENDSSNLNDNVIIKVKLSSKLKKKIKKKKLSLPKANNDTKSESVSIDCSIEISSDVTVNSYHSDSNSNKDRRKRKRNDVIDSTILNSNNCNDIQLPDSECRPKRNIKKPVKYADDVEVCSSDDDLHIFTPKKKKHSDKKTPKKHNTNIDQSNITKTAPEIVKKPDNTDHTIKKKGAVKVEKKPDKARGVNKLKEVEKKNVKLAPIFAVKTQLDPAALEAKQKFLHSGVPEKLKKVNSDQKYKNVEQCIFPTTVHIQQSTVTYGVPKLISLINHDESDELCISLEDNLFRNMINSSLDEKETQNDISNCDKYTTLQYIKKIYPKFPVFRTYRLLKEKKCGEGNDFSYLDLDNSIEVIYGINDLVNESPDKLNWSDKYKATSSKHIIGNFDSIKELRKWLITWTENQAKSKNKVSFESDSSDFYNSDTDSKESFKATNNLLMITGPVGSGKTSGVYAVAAELAIKVIEVNASSKRTGKIMLQDLQEATQSHKVNRGKSSAENSQKSQEIPEKNVKTYTKRGRPKKHVETTGIKNTVQAVKTELLSQGQPSSSQENARTEMSLILIDDADIVFDQDDGFCSAIVQLVQSSKRPVILITSTASCTHLQRFLQIAKIINMHPLQPRMLGTWLDIMCLADSGICVPGTGATILDFFKGDIRKAINCLQFCVSSQIQTEIEKESNTPNSDTVPYIDDENSSMSWAEHDNTEDKHSSPKNLDNRLHESIIGHQRTLSQYSRPLDLFNIWWSIPSLLISPIDFKTLSKENNDEQCSNIKKTVGALEAVANAMDSISIAEYYKGAKTFINPDVTCHPWLSVEHDSVSESEHSYDYNRDEEVIDEISHKLVSGSILEAQNILKIENSTDIQSPDMNAQRERDRLVSRHHNLSSCLNPSAVLDHKALALDYWSYCRTICRIEKSKTDNKSKRNNRFCHYLKSLNVMCKTDYFDKLADSLYTTSGPDEEAPLEIE